MVCKLFFLFVVSLSVVSTQASCKITLIVKSTTKTPFQFQVYIPSLHQKTERITFRDPSEKKVLVKGPNCMDKKWIVKTWKKSSDDEWVPAAQTSGKLGGIGTFRILVGDDLKPYGHDRLGVACSESDGLLCG